MNKKVNTGSQLNKNFSDLRVFIFLFILCFALYGNTIPNRYAIDDDMVTANNETIKKGIGGIPEILTTHYRNNAAFKYEYRPLVKITYALEYALFGTNPHVSHLVNILLYFLSSLLLYRLLKKVFPGLHPLFPIAVTALFIAHPIHTEVVASLKSRDEILSFLFSILTLHYIIKLGENGRKVNFFFIFLFFVMGLLSKQTTMVFGAIGPLTLFYTTKNTRISHLLILILTFAFIYLLFRYLQRNFIDDTMRVKSYWDNPLFFHKGLAVRSATAMIVLLFYLKILIVPYPLLFYYGYDMIPLGSWSQPMVIVSFALHLALLGFALFRIRRRDPLAYGILCYLFAISMFSNLVKPAVGIVAERFAYTASLGFCIAITAVIFMIFKSLKHNNPNKRQQSGIVAVLLLIIIAYSVKTIARNFDWKDHYTLYSSDIKYLDRSAKANDLYAAELMRQVNEDMLKTKDINRNIAKIRLALRHFKQSYTVDGSNYSAFNNSGLIYFVLLRNNDSAEYFFRRAIEANPRYERGNFNLALVFENKGETDSAITYYRKTVQIDSSNVHAASNMANLYFEVKKDMQQAIRINRRMMTQDPDNALPWFNIGLYYLKSADTVLCLSYWEKAAEKPNIEPDFLNALAAVYQSKNQPDKAAYYLDRARRINQQKMQKKEN